jgi:Phage portal protein
MSLVPYSPSSAARVIFSPGRDGVMVRSAIRRAAGMRSSPKRIPLGSAVSLTWNEKGRVGKANVKLFRYWAEHSEWLRAGINIRRDQVAGAEWKIMPIDPEKPYSIALQQQLTDGLMHPNPKNLGWRTFISPIVEDILVLDAGSIEKERNLRGQIVYMHYVDGGVIKVNARWDGDPDESRYYWYPDFQERASWKNGDFIYMMSNPATYREVGLSPVETLKMTIDGELSGQSYNSRQVTNAAPDGMLDLGENARPDQVDKFRDYWAAEIAGKGAMAFVGGTKNPKFIPFRTTNRDMQFLEFQIYYVRKICAVLGLSPQDLGVTFDVNRASSEVQQENTEDRGLRPLLGLVQDHMTMEYVWDEGFGGPSNNLAFVFTALNLKESLSRAQINRYALAGVPWKTVNESRKDDGRPPFPEPIYDQLIANTAQGIAVLSDIPTARELTEKEPPSPPVGAGTSKSALIGVGLEARGLEVEV